MAKRSSTGRAKVLERSFWLSDRILTAKFLVPVIVAKLRELRARQISSNGGSSETEVKELAVKPMGFPASSRVVTIVTPVTKAPNASRKARGSRVATVIAAPPLKPAIRPSLH
ncbi:hypothetical protein D3C86_1952270 [compost metagenome]